MNRQVEALVNKLGENKISGSDFVVKVCPICLPTEKSNFNTFKVDTETGVYHCHRGKCNAGGSFDKLYRLVYGTERNKNVVIPKKTESKIKKTTTELSKKVLDYCLSRGITKETLIKSNVHTDNFGNSLVFNHYKDDRVIAQKFRKVPEKDFFTTGNTKNFSLWNWNNINKDKEIIITEGELDALTLIEAGVENVSSMPMGCENNDWLDKDFEELEKIQSIVIWPDNDAPGLKQKTNLIERLGIYKVRVVRDKYKDANEAFLSEGSDYVKQAIKSSQREHITDFVQAHKVTERMDWKFCEKFRTGIPELDNLLGGGLPMFGYTVLSGYRGSGKTSFANNLVVSAINQGYRTLYFSGEMEADYVTSTLEKIIAGSNNLENGIASPRIKEYFTSNSGRMIWINEKKLIYTADKMLKKIEDMIRRYGIRCLIIDNLMKIKFAGRSLIEMLENQDNFCQQIDEIASKYKVQIILIQHPTKTDKKMVTDNIRGSGRITDTACNVLIIHRMNTVFKAINQGIYGSMTENALISVEKNRYGGNEFELPLNFMKETERFVRNDLENENPRLLEF